MNFDLDLVLFHTFVNFISIVRVFVVINILFLAIEFTYSRYKKDGVYSVKGTVNNVIHGLILSMFGTRVLFSFLILFLDYANFINLKIPINWPSFVACIVLVDLIYYLFHYLHHHVDFLWMFHMVHHSDNKMNLSTSERISWFEYLYLGLFFLPLLLLGFHPVEIFFAIFILSEYQFFSHSQYLSFPKFLDYALITPHNHRVHHDIVFKHQNSNYGGIFSVWDRMFGTYTAEIPTFNPGMKNYSEDNFIKYELFPIFNFVKKKINKHKNGSKDN